MRSLVDGASQHTPDMIPTQHFALLGGYLDTWRGDLQIE
jgi:hypothetical protein